jgi:hypothetical protein
VLRRYNPRDPCSKWAYLPPERREDAIERIQTIVRMRMPTDGTALDLLKGIDALRHLGRLGAHPYPVDDKFVEMLDSLNGHCNLHIHARKTCDGCILHRAGQNLCWLGEMNQAVEKGGSDGDSQSQ